MFELFYNPNFKTMLQEVNNVFNLSKDVENYNDTVGDYLISENSSAENIFNAIIFNKYKDYLGKIQVKRMIESINQVIGAKKLLSFFDSPESFGATTEERKIGFCGIKLLFNNVSLKKDYIASGIITKDIYLSDNDCYQTAGGYRNYLLKKGEVVNFKLNTFTGELEVVYDCYLMTDHYNNNVAGVSTGNGTTNYKYGDIKAQKIVNLKTHKFTDLVDIEDLQIDLNKGKELIKTILNE